MEICLRPSKPFDKNKTMPNHVHKINNTMIHFVQPPQKTCKPFVFFYFNRYLCFNYMCVHVLLKNTVFSDIVYISSFCFLAIHVTQNYMINITPEMFLMKNVYKIFWRLLFHLLLRYYIKGCLNRLKQQQQKQLYFQLSLSSPKM